MGNSMRGHLFSRGIYVHDGSIRINDNYVHIKVNSERDPDKEYYVSVNVNTGAVERCTCPAFGLYPETLCKHCRAVIDQRMLQI